ncbi:hypothetical protein JCM31826_12270 [Thermaurantimonas aggregans]|uniref:Uncharacterized protein n=1 Tax=Thermaurantimonas aggregans TaxID=2173829 RepID=A0A401XL33_9FLAO|nr:hypothetical protein [Thermaurantimonas aggregans]MCX8149686.1 hypothetical protein [Thermaurantimonas aggregans]GCD77745.1 hypothetical protein JCM31826_12270 [Thermaurantimonas aggregans]
MTHAQHFFLNDFRGQFFEQGYGGSHDEEALDILITPSKHTVLCGWQESPEADRKDFTLWYISDIGEPLREINYPHPMNHSIATAIAPLSSDQWIV